MYDTPQLRAVVKEIGERLDKQRNLMYSSIVMTIVTYLLASLLFWNEILEVIEKEPLILVAIASLLYGIGGLIFVYGIFAGLIFLASFPFKELKKWYHPQPIEPHEKAIYYLVTATNKIEEVIGLPQEKRSDKLEEIKGLFTRASDEISQLRSDLQYDYYSKSFNELLNLERSIRRKIVPKLSDKPDMGDLESIKEFALFTGAKFAEKNNSFENNYLDKIKETEGHAERIVAFLKQQQSKINVANIAKLGILLIISIAAAAVLKALFGSAIPDIFTLTIGIMGVLGLLLSK